MWSRKELKERARFNIRKNYWAVLCVCFIMAFFIGEYGQASGLIRQYDETHEKAAVNDTHMITNSDIVNDVINNGNTKLPADHPTRGVLASVFNNVTQSGSFVFGVLNSLNTMVFGNHIFAGIVIFIGAVISFLAWMYGTNLLIVGEKRFMLESRLYHKTHIRKILFLYRLRCILRPAYVMFMRALYTFFWAFTIAGGFIKYYSYILIPYLIAENPRMTRKEAFSLSRQMMKGNKWRTFVLDLSFIGWFLLELLSSGIAGYLWVIPYRASVYAELYIKLREKAIADKIPHYESMNDDALVAYPPHIVQKLLEKHAQPGTAQTAQPDLVQADGMQAAQPDLSSADGVQTVQPDLSRADTVQNVPQGVARANFVQTVQDGVTHANLVQTVQEDVSRYLDEGPQDIYPTDAFAIQAPQTRKLRTVDYHRTYSLRSLVELFFIFSMVGWVWEVSLHLFTEGEFVNRGVLQGPWLPIYGSGGVLILVLLKRWIDRPVVTFILITLICGVVEYFTSWFLEVTKGQKWWDYSGYLLNLNGRICLEGLLTFGLGGCMFLYFIAPWLDDKLQRIPPRVQNLLCVSLLAAFISDLAYSQVHPNMGKGITDISMAPAQEKKCAAMPVISRQKGEMPEKIEIFNRFV